MTESSNMADIRTQRIYTISRDIPVPAGLAFRRGERVVVESITPNPYSPQHRYLVFSVALQQRFQLSDADLMPGTVGMPAAPQSPRQQVAGDQGTNMPGAQPAGPMVQAAAPGRSEPFWNVKRVLSLLIIVCALDLLALFFFPWIHRANVLGIPASSSSGWGYFRVLGHHGSVVFIAEVATVVVSILIILVFGFAFIRRAGTPKPLFFLAMGAFAAEAVIVAWAILHIRAVNVVVTKEVGGGASSPSVWLYVMIGVSLAAIVCAMISLLVGRARSSSFPASARI